MLKDGKLVPGIEGNDRPQHRRQILGARQHGLPLLQPLVLIPVEIVDEGILFRSVFGAPRLLGLFDRRLRARQEGIDGGELGIQRAFWLVTAFIATALRPSPPPSDTSPATALSAAAVPPSPKDAAGRACRRPRRPSSDKAHTAG